MADLMCLPALTALEPHSFAPGAYAFLPRLPALQLLTVSLPSGQNEAQQAGHDALLVSSLSACPALTHLTLAGHACTELFGEQLPEVVPRLRSLRFDSCSLPSLRFLQHASHLEELRLFDCDNVRIGHVVGIGVLVPHLEWLTVEECDGLQLHERWMLTLPGAFGLPRLREFKYAQVPPRRLWYQRRWY